MTDGQPPGKAPQSNRRDPEGRFVGLDADQLRAYASRLGVSDYHIDSIFKYEADPPGEIARLIALMQESRGTRSYSPETVELTPDEEQIFSQMLSGAMEPETIV